MKDTKHQKFWKKSFSNELDMLAQGIGKIVKGTDTFVFINYNDITSEGHKDITYSLILVDNQP